VKKTTLSALALMTVLGTGVLGFGAGVPGSGTGAPGSGAGATGTGAEDDPRALMIQARAMQRRGGGDDPKGAAAIYRKVIALVPTSSQAQLRLSEAILETNDLEGAV